MTADYFGFKFNFLNFINIFASPQTHERFSLPLKKTEILRKLEIVILRCIFDVFVETVKIPINVTDSWQKKLTILFRSCTTCVWLFKESGTYKIVHNTSPDYFKIRQTASQGIWFRFGAVLNKGAIRRGSKRIIYFPVTELVLRFLPNLAVIIKVFWYFAFLMILGNRF